MSYGGHGYGGGHGGGYGQGGYGGQQGGYGGVHAGGHGAPGGYAPPVQAGQYGGAPVGYGGGFSSPPSRAPPPGADPQLWHWFSSVDSDRSGMVTAVELEQALVNGDWTRFDLDTVKLLMTLFDADRSGTIGFAEFVGLYNYIKEWQGVFRRFDQDNSGSIDLNELQTALQSFGFNLNPRLVDLVQRKYDIKATAQGRGAAVTGITFDRFVRACVVIKQIHESFIRWDTQRRGVVQLSYEDFMSTVLTLP